MFTKKNNIKKFKKSDWCLATWTSKNFMEFFSNLKLESKSILNWSNHRQLKKI